MYFTGVRILISRDFQILGDPFYTRRTARAVTYWQASISFLSMWYVLVSCFAFILYWFVLYFFTNTVRGEDRSHPKIIGITIGHVWGGWQAHLAMGCSGAGGVKSAGDGNHSKTTLLLEVHSNRTDRTALASRRGLVHGSFTRGLVAWIQRVGMNRHEQSPVLKLLILLAWFWKDAARPGQPRYMASGYCLLDAARSRRVSSCSVAGRCRFVWESDPDTHAW